MITSNIDANVPRLHIHPDSGWLNDPHGIFEWEGRWHLFYQHNPDDVVWGNIHWAHVSSTDLAHWTHHPIALFTRPDKPDAAVCSTGAVTFEKGTPVLAYTATVDSSGIGPVLLATPADPQMLEWEQGTRGVTTPAAVEGELRGFRDPYFFDHGGKRFAVMTGGRIDGPPEILLFDTSRIEDWAFVGTLLSGDDPIAASVAPAQLWECPQLFQHKESWVLIVSLWTDNVLGDVAYLVGDIDWDDVPTFRPSSGGLVDHGRDFYAPTVHVNDSLVRMWGWSADADSLEARQERGTTGALTFPRLLHIDANNRLRQRFDPALVGLRAACTSSHEQSVAPHESIHLGSLADSAELELELELELDASAELELFVGAGCRLILHVSADEVTLSRDDHQVNAGPRPTISARVTPEETTRNVHLFVDGSLVEILVDGTSFTERVYKRDDVPLSISLRNTGMRVIRAFRSTMYSLEQPSRSVSV